jgi:type II secretory pathway pseudopilin PulG
MRNTGSAEAQARYTNDSGFALVEILVSISIFSFLAVASLGLIAMLGKGRSELAAVDNISVALLELQAAGDDLIERYPTIEELLPGQHKIVLRGTDAEQAAALNLLQSDQGLSVLLDVHGHQSRISLSEFESASFSYLAEDSPYWAWEPFEDLSTGEVFAVRLVLERGFRRWPIVLWTAPDRR